MKVSDLFVRCLENEGVRYVFGVPGEENEDLLFSLRRSSIRFVTTRHEQGAAFMADVWGRLSGKAGVCLSTLGPGATNLMTGVADAQLDKSPLVAITGQAGLERIHKEGHQRLDIVQMFRPITKWNASVKFPDAVPEIVRKAFKVAESEKPGATHIELSEDIAKKDSAASPLPVVGVRRPDPDEIALDEAAALIRKARKSIILAGNGAVRKPSSKELRALVETYKIPVVHTFMGQGAISDESSESLLTIGLAFRDFVMEAVDEADLVIAVGYDLTEYAPSAWNPKKNKKIIHIDFTSAEVDSHYQPAVEIVADISLALRQIKGKLDKSFCRFDNQWYQPVRNRILQDIRSYALNKRTPFTVPGTLNLLRSIMEDEDLLISDVGAHKIWIARNFPSCCPNGCVMSNGLASMGIALPGAIAAALLFPGRRIVAAMGDGGFLMNSQEIETAKRLGVAFTILVFNDNDYGLISWKQRMSGEEPTGTRLTNPDLKAYAESFGIRGYKPQTAAELERQLKDAHFSGELALIEVDTDASVNDELLRRLNITLPKSRGARQKNTAGVD